MYALLVLLQVLPAAPPPASARAIPPATIADPTPEALALGRRLAETGTLSSLLPMIAAKETDELVAAHPGLPPAEQAELRRTAAMTLTVGADRLFAAEARAFAERLTVEELRALLAFETSPPAIHRRAAVPAAVAAAMAAIGSFDFKRDAWAAFCAKPGRRC